MSMSCLWTCSYCQSVLYVCRSVHTRVNVCTAVLSFYMSQSQTARSLVQFPPCDGSHYSSGSQLWLKSFSHNVPVLLRLRKGQRSWLSNQVGFRREDVFNQLHSAGHETEFLCVWMLVSITDTLTQYCTAWRTHVCMHRLHSTLKNIMQEISGFNLFFSTNLIFDLHFWIKQQKYSNRRKELRGEIKATSL